MIRDQAGNCDPSEKLCAKLIVMGNPYRALRAKSLCFGFVSMISRMVSRGWTHMLNQGFLFSLPGSTFLPMISSCAQARAVRQADELL